MKKLTFFLIISRAEQSLNVLLLCVGFTNVSDPCCEVSTNGLSCKENGNVCDNRDNYVYFDGQHNTEALSAAMATKAYSSCDQSEVFPDNLHELARAHHIRVQT